MEQEQAASVEAWARFERELELALTAFGPKQILILQMKDSGRYLQVLVDAGPMLHAELSSNEVLKEEERFTAAEIAALKALGWGEPEAGKSPNFFALVEGAMAVARAARLAVLSVSRVMGATSTRAFKYEAFTSRGHKILLPQLGSALAQRPTPGALLDIDWEDRHMCSESGEPVSPTSAKLMGRDPIAPPPGKRWVDVFDEELDYLALVTSYLARAEYARSTEVGLYWSQRVELLEHLLGFSLEAVPIDIACESEFIAEDLQRVARNCIEMHAQIRSPVGDYLEGEPHPLVQAIATRHRTTFNALDRSLRRTCGEVLAEVLRALSPGITERKVRKSELFDLGLDWWEPESLPRL